MINGVLTISPEVQAALSAGEPVVALESTILAHGLPRGENRTIADTIERTVRDAGAVPATIAVLRGSVRIGLEPADLDLLCSSDEIAKLSIRDVGPALASGVDGATTVASTAALAHRAGIAVFATGGLGGVHRGAADSFDISADLGVIARTPVAVVCAGVKSILDVAATLEHLETLSVPVLGYRTDAFPGFYLADSGLGVPWRVESAHEVATIIEARRQLGEQAGVVLANPVSATDQLDPALHDETLTSGLQLLAERRITGKDITPALLEHFHTRTQGESLRVNVDLVLSNATLAGELAVALAALRARPATSEPANPEPATP